MRAPFRVLLAVFLAASCPALAQAGDTAEKPLPPDVTDRRDEAVGRWREWGGTRHGTDPQLERGASGEVTRFRQIFVSGQEVSGPWNRQLVLMEWRPRTPGLYDERWFAQSGQLLSERGVRPHPRHPFRLVFSEPYRYARSYYPNGKLRSREAFATAHRTRYEAWLEDGTLFGVITGHGKSEKVAVTHPGAKQELAVCAREALRGFRGPSGAYGLHEKMGQWDRPFTVSCTSGLGTSVHLEYSSDGRLRLRQHLTRVQVAGQEQTALRIERWDGEGRLRAEVSIARGEHRGHARCFLADGSLRAEGQVRLEPGAYQNHYAITGAWTTWNADGGVLRSLEDVEREMPNGRWACLEGIDWEEPGGELNGAR